MNRLRHAYLELAPELEPYFVTGHHVDIAGLTQTYGLGNHSGLSRALSPTPNLVAVINAVVVGVLAALIAETFGVPDAAAVVLGVVAALAALIGLSVLVFRQMKHVWRTTPRHKPMALAHFR
jgi:hypothetical protein